MNSVTADGHELATTLKLPALYCPPLTHERDDNDVLTQFADGLDGHLRINKRHFSALTEPFLFSLFAVGYTLRGGFYFQGAKEGVQSLQLCLAADNT